MTGRIDATFQRLGRANQPGFIAYVTAGDPTPDAFPGILAALEGAGTDLIEVGIPFSDPVADGPTIQAAAGRALAAGMTVPKALEAIREFRRHSETPVVIFTYLNPIFAFGIERFVEEAVRVGADGLLALDLPPEEAILPEGLAPIRLVAPTTPPERMRGICASGRGFIYYVSREGVTGEQSDLAESLPSQIATLKSLTSLPIAVGFGISTPRQAREVALHADAVVVGSAIVRRIAEHPDDPEGAIREFVTPLAQAAREARL